MAKIDYNDYDYRIDIIVAIMTIGDILFIAFHGFRAFWHLMWTPQYLFLVAVAMTGIVFCAFQDVNEIVRDE